MSSLRYDTVIVGAGLSGLQAALDLHEAGRSILVLEARDRVGGKINSYVRPDGKGIQELGATWLNDTNQSHIWEYCQKFGLTPVIQNTRGDVACEDVDGKCHMFPFGGLPKFDAADVHDIRTLRDKVEAASLDAATFMPPLREVIDQMTFEQWCKSVGAGPRALQSATLWTRGTLGQDPCDISALAYLEIARGGLGIVNLRFDGKHGAQYLRLQEGTQAIAKGIASLLPGASIRLETPVTSIRRQGDDAYSITTQPGETVLASSVLISIPGPAYKNIDFVPRLPRLRQVYTSAAQYGCFIKYICLFRTPFWRAQGSCGLMQSFRGPINHCRDTSVDSQGNYALTCFICSSPGRQWATHNELDQRETVLTQLGNVFAVGYQAVKQELLGTVVSEWMDDKWAGLGCPFAAPPPGVIGDGTDEWHEAASDGLYFVGTEFTNEWRGYMEGALRSGKRGAAQILARQRAESSRQGSP